MAEAQMHDGRAIVAYRGDVALDSEGVAIKGAPKPPKDTDPSEQPGALGAPTPEERMGLAIANALQGKVPASVGGQKTARATAESGPGADAADELPKIADLDAHLAGLSSVAEVKALQKRDERVSAEPKYKARIAELKASE
jgi:hypothetical protein